MAEQKARLAQQQAEKERAEAGVMEQRAQMHERGMADDELVADDERERFSPVMGNGEGEAGTTPERDTTTGDDRRFDRTSPTADDTRPSDRAER